MYRLLIDANGEWVSSETISRLARVEWMNCTARDLRKVGIPVEHNGKKKTLREGAYRLRSGL